MKKCKKKQEVLHVVSSYSGIQGGIEIVASSLCSGIKRHGIHASVFSCNNIQDCFELFKKIVCEKPDIIHLHGFRLASLFAALPATFLGKPMVITPHFDINEISLKQKINFWAHKNIGFRKIIAVTEIEKKILLGMGFREEKIEVIPNGIDLECFNKAFNAKAFRKKFSIGKKDFLVLFVGRIAANKGIPVLIEAFSLLERKNKKLLVIGREDKRFPDTRYDFLKKKAKEFGVEDSVLVAGEMPRKEVFAAMKACNVLVLPSLSSEAFGLVLAEAMAAGKPVIATCVGGIPAVVENGLNGFLVEPGKPKEICRALEKLAGSRALREKMGKKGRKKVVKQYSLEKVAEKYIELYKSLLK